MLLTYTHVKRQIYIYILTRKRYVRAGYVAFIFTQRKITRAHDHGTRVTTTTKLKHTRDHAAGVRAFNVFANVL